MSLKNPTIPTLTYLRGIDLRIQELQAAISAALPWLGKSFGLADRIVEVKDGKDFVYPACFESNHADPVQMLPSDLYNSFSFWVKTGEAKFEKKMVRGYYPVATYEVSCIIYADIRRIDATLTYKETKSKMVEDIFHFFNTVWFKGELKQVSFYEDDITKIWDGFSIEQVDNIHKIYPKWACKMDLELSFRDTCYTVNRYALINPGTSITADNTTVTVDSTSYTADMT